MVFQVVPGRAQNRDNVFGMQAMWQLCWDWPPLYHRLRKVSTSSFRSCTISTRTYICTDPIVVGAGIVVGTLGDRGYLQAARHVHKLAQAAGKKTYRLLMGRPSPAKLANFPEVEVFVMVADAPGLVLDDSKDYYAPVITPWEALLAFDDDLEWTGEYRLGFQCLLVSPPPPPPPPTFACFFTFQADSR